MDYSSWVKKKAVSIKPSGFEPVSLNDRLYDFQSAITARAIRQGRFCIFADCGMGKGPMLLSWADEVYRYTDQPVLVMAPLAVSEQLVRESEKFGIDARIVASHDDVASGINITNYEKLDKFDPSIFGGVVLDESSILKSHTGKYRTEITDAFRSTPYRLACSATPSPNDFIELGTHAEFMGVMTREEMLAMYFTHDGGNTSKWRLKGHAQDDFWNWVCEWAIMIRNPSDLGYDGSDYVLPELCIKDVVVDSDVFDKSGNPIVSEAKTLTEQRNVKRSSLEERCQQAASLINNDTSNSQWLVFCYLNDESKRLKELIDGATEVKGADKDNHKKDSMIGFQSGDIRILVSKPSICGFGMNFQGCHNVVFVGLSHSFEAYYQAVRRCYRFGQTEPVNAFFVYHNLEGLVTKNIRDKESKFLEMAQQMAARMRFKMQSLIDKTTRTVTEYKPTKLIKIADWLIKSSMEDAA